MSDNRAMSYIMPFRLTVCGVSELDGHCGAGVTHVLSILDPGTPRPLAFDAFGPHHRLELRFDDVVQEHHGYQAPTEADVEAVLRFGEQIAQEAPREEQHHVLVHCWMGISRSTASAAMLLAQQAPGHEEAAFQSLYSVRQRCWPNSRMIGFADKLLKRRGALVRAFEAHKRHILRHHPDIAALVRNVGRGAELPED
jgi:predicted protein tyrosine phosphatase